MRLLTIGLLAAAGLALAIPANAQSVSVGVGDDGARVGARVGVHEHSREGVVVREHSREDVVVRRHPRRERVTVGFGERHRHCKVVIIHRGDMTKKIKRCS